MLLNRLEELLKKKGIGPQGSKSLSLSEVAEVQASFLNPSYSLTTKATMLVALLILEPNEDEKNLIDQIKTSPEEYLPEQLVSYLRPALEESFLGRLQKVIQKVDLTYEEAYECIKTILSDEVEDYLKASFLEGQRLKRETFDENKAFFDALLFYAKHQLTTLPVLIDICDAYDGSNRSMSFTPFIAATLAAAGFPTLIHGVERVAPKQGYTSHLMLKYTGKKVNASITEVLSQLEDDTVGWGYVDQQVFFPELFNMRQMRKEMVKRPFLATFEKLLQPIRSSGGNYVVTGYTHKHYRDEVPNQLRAQGLAQQALVLRGVEGSTALNMSRAVEGILYNGKEVKEIEADPLNYDVQYQENYRNPEVDYEEVVRLAIKALEGDRNYAFDNIKYTSSLILEMFGLVREGEGHQLVEEVMLSGKALFHWNNLS